jgi:hypothetical protein
MPKFWINVAVWLITACWYIKIMDSLALDSGADMPAIRPACPKMMAAISYGQARDYRNPIIRFLAAHHDMWPARLSKGLNWKKLILGLGFLQTKNVQIQRLKPV